MVKHYLENIDFWWCWLTFINMFSSNCTSTFSCCLTYEKYLLYKMYHAYFTYKENGIMNYYVHSFHATDSGILKFSCDIGFIFLRNDCISPFALVTMELRARYTWHFQQIWKVLSHVLITNIIWIVSSFSIDFSFLLVSTYFNVLFCCPLCSSDIDTNELMWAQDIHTNRILIFQCQV